MIIIPFTKVESIGNDFVLVESLLLPKGAFDGLPALARAACKRRFGVGSDGMLVVDLSDGVSMRMFNPDGSEDFCGNGLRCTALFANQRHRASEAFDILHGGKRVPARVLADGSVQTIIGPGSYDPAIVPTTLSQEVFDEAILEDEGQILKGSSLSTGSTHTILWTNSLPVDETFLRLGPQLEHDARFPKRTSVIWAMVDGQDRIAIRIWERGGGETLGCGTGSSAAAVDYWRLRGRGGTLEVVNPGGSVTVSAEQWNAPLQVVGAAKLLYDGEFRYEPD